jgi:hypothetical protein
VVGGGVAVQTEEVTVRRFCTLQPPPNVLVIPVAGEPSRVIWILEAQRLGVEFLSHCVLTLFTCQSIEGPLFLLQFTKCVHNPCSQASIVVVTGALWFAAVSLYYRYGNKRRGGEVGLRWRIVFATKT